MVTFRLEREAAWRALGHICICSLCELIVKYAATFFMNHYKSFTVSTLKGGILLPEAIKGMQVYWNYILRRQISDVGELFCFVLTVQKSFSKLFSIYFCTIVATHMNKMHKSGPRLWFVWSCLSAQHARFSVITGEAVSGINMFSHLFLSLLLVWTRLTHFLFFPFSLPASSSLLSLSLSRFLTSSQLLPHVLICLSTSCP